MSLVVEAPAQVAALLLAPIDSKTPAGLFDIEDETYQAIDQEMVKLGGLQEANIDWQYIEEASQQYLSSRCKQFRILVHLGTAWLRRRCWERWCTVVNVLAGMVETYWESAYPKPGPTGYLTKRKLVEGLLKRLATTLPTLERASFVPAHGALAQESLARLMKCSGSAQLDQAALLELQRLLEEQATAARDGPSKQSLAIVPSSSDDSLGRTLLSAQNGISLGNDRETRHAVLTMAEFINQQDIYDPTGYQLRRFGLWAHVHALPPVRKELRTELMAVPVEIVSRYQDALSGTVVEPELLLRVERSVVASPFWARGSFMAASIANRLAMGEVAEAIRQATERFVRRLPAMQQLCFSDGTAFVDEQCMAWLKGSGTAQGADSHCHEFQRLREELVAQLEQEGVEHVLLRLQALQGDYRSPRERCHATLIAADLLASRGLSWLAGDLCAGVARTMQETMATQWEPDVYQKLKQCGGSSRLND
ncbi:hypothetical protein D3C77_106920 [compost metagenome]|uniref:type VI secretion system protein TssA n=1 Tax=Pseudomonas TaxID=286 RepID=UPI0003F6E46C|nr:MULTISPECIES: type VI secretion system protein TssA [Pseudomonas]MCW2271236.1 type VI secretion system protein VasJ [Pseudomonas sp. JUb96]PRA58177.1 type VI secretion system protein TssA [Pseudomonas sp. MYb187]